MRGVAGGRRAMAAVGMLLASAAGLALVLGAPAQGSSSESKQGAVSAGPVTWARALSSWEKVRPGKDPGGASGYSLSMARGECEGLQIYAAPPAQKVDAVVEPLAGPGTPLRPRLYREEFIEVKTPSNAEGEIGLWPDPLIPVQDAYTEERRKALPWDSTRERPLVLYVEVCAPESQAPGTYEGHVVVTARDRSRVRLPIRAEVHPFVLPATSSLPNTFGISIFSMAQGHGLEADTDEARKLLGDYAKAALTHRFSLHGMGIDPPPTKVVDGVAQIDWTRYDREVGPFLEGKALPNGARFTTTEVRPNPWLKTEEERRAYLKAFREHFDQKGWTAQLFFYAKDEPKPEDVPLVLQQSREARTVKRLPVLVTAPLHEQLTPAADIVSPVLNCFYERSGPKTCPRITSPEELRRAVGPSRQIWWYQACPAHGCDSGPFEDPELERAYSGWPSYMVDHATVLNRAMGVLNWLGGVDGELYFATIYAYNFRDPWSEGVWDFGGNGDGTLFYPGTPSKIGGRSHVPVESLRLKHLRDGLEDYEYLHLLRSLGGETFARTKARQLVRSGYEIERKPQRWDEVRAELTDRLNALWKKAEYARRSDVGPKRE